MGADIDGLVFGLIPLETLKRMETVSSGLRDNIRRSQSSVVQAMADGLQELMSRAAAPYTKRANVVIGVYVSTADFELSAGTHRRQLGHPDHPLLDVDGMSVTECKELCMTVAAAIIDGGVKPLDFTAFTIGPDSSDSPREYNTLASGLGSRFSRIRELAGVCRRLGFRDHMAHDFIQSVPGSRVQGSGGSTSCLRVFVEALVVSRAAIHLEISGNLEGQPTRFHLLIGTSHRPSDNGAVDVKLRLRIGRQKKKRYNGTDPTQIRDMDFGKVSRDSVVILTTMHDPTVPPGQEQLAQLSDFLSGICAPAE